MVAVTIVLKIIIIPPIVGVPVFFMCDFGPSSLMLCPNLRRRKNGMNNGEIRTVIKNAIAIVINSTDILIFFLLVPNRPTYYIELQTADNSFKVHTSGCFEQ